MKPLYNILEQWADKVKPKWHPKEGLFTGDDPEYIANYLLKHSEDRGQAMQRLNFYMNRAGDNLTNKTVLNKVKKILSESLLDKDFDIDELKEVYLALSPIYSWKWEVWDHTARNWNQCQKHFDEILDIIKQLIKTHKKSKLAMVDVYLNTERSSILHIVEDKAASRPAQGIRIAISSPFNKEQLTAYYSGTWDATRIASEQGMKKIGQVPYAVVHDLKEKLQLD